ncbi:MFS transporter [Kitasatospora sp. NA04385]|uniref:MDR family MFS transporter n=1 Tax=Kitasatospora sp. NA04385 TaxID=2742135 RepID=UPI0015901756|nr:MDR family MFS transporter [Kitasatospora sp. NA04385]QKW21679.1 MFS transporter [Kitasatospora sp. NA04385]
MSAPTTAAGAAAPVGDRFLMTPRQVKWTVAGVILAAMLSALDQAIVAVATLPIVRDLDPASGIDLMPWLITAYMLASTATQPLYGRISDIFGPRRVFLSAAGIFVAGSALCGVSQSMVQLIGARVIQGLGAGGLYSVSLIVLATVVAPKDRPKFQGIAAVVILVSTVLGPILGGYLTGDHALFGMHTNWRWIFYVNLPIGLVGLAVVHFTLKLPKRSRGRDLDLLGSALAVAGTSAILLLTTWGGNRYAWGSWQILGLAAAGVALLALFVWRQARAAEPIIPLRLFREPVVAIATPMLFVMGFAMMGGIIYVATYLQVVFGYSATSAGLHMIPLVIGMLGASIASGGMISSRGGYKIFPIIGSAASVAGLALLGLMKPDSSYWLLAVAVFLLGIGMGLLMSVLLLAVQNAVPSRDLGTGTTTATYFRTLGQSFGGAVFGAILTVNYDSFIDGKGVQAPGEHGFHAEKLAALPAQARDLAIRAFSDATDRVFLVAAGVLVISLLLSFFLRDMPLREISDMDVIDLEHEVVHDEAAGPAGSATAARTGAGPATGTAPQPATSG